MMAKGDGDHGSESRAVGAGLSAETREVDVNASRHESALLEIRDELRRRYPLINPWRVTRIAKRHGFSALPAGMLLSGSTRLGGAVERQLIRLVVGAVRRRDVPLHPLMNNEFYRAVNPDVAAARVAPWLHYQVFGRQEGRSPHPLLSLESLGRQLPAVPPAQLVDTYLADRATWAIEPSPFVDIGQFMTNGPWDHRQHPLTQIVRDHAFPPWLRTDLMLVDSGAESRSAGDLTAALLLLGAGTARRGRGSIVERWVAGTPAVEGARDVRVVPGSLVGVAGVYRQLAGASTGWLADESGRVGELEAVLRRPAATVRGASHLVLEGDVDRADLNRALEQLPTPIVVSPASAAQRQALAARASHRPAGDLIVVPLGQQTTVRAERHLVLSSEPLDAPSMVVRDLSHPDVSTTAIVVADSEVAEWGSAAEVLDLVRQGAHLCIVTGDDVGPWAETLERSDRVVSTVRSMRMLRSALDLRVRHCVLLEGAPS